VAVITTHLPSASAITHQVIRLSHGPFQTNLQPARVPSIFGLRPSYPLPSYHRRNTRNKSRVVVSVSRLDEWWTSHFVFLQTLCESMHPSEDVWDLSVVNSVQLILALFTPRPYHLPLQPIASDTDGVVASDHNGTIMVGQILRSWTPVALFSSRPLHVGLAMPSLHLAYCGAVYKVST
jgi:hypothetical protein